jgi:thioredoxin-related protein
LNRLKHLIFLLILFISFKASSEPAKLLIFTGSDWCPNCRRLDKNILRDSTFIHYAKDRVVLEFVDFPQHKKLDTETIEKNRALAEKYHFQGIYPTILVLDEQGNKKGQIIYRNQRPAEFIDELKMILGK